MCTLIVESASLLQLTVSFFFNDTATTEIYTLSLHDALPIFTLADGVLVSSAAFTEPVHMSMLDLQHKGRL